MFEEEEAFYRNRYLILSNKREKHEGNDCSSCVVVDRLLQV